MSITVEARYQACQLLLEQPLSLPEGQRVRVTIEPIDDAPVGQQIVAQWRTAGVIGAWATRRQAVSSAQWARQLRTRASRRTR
jgi:predicted DNA-binding antitoxin AbrB/MazE fold protein